jgi:hypothetical protein
MFVVLLLALMQSVGAQQQSAKITLRCHGTSRLVVSTGAELEFAPVTNLSIIVSGGDQTVSFLDNVVPITGHPLACWIQQSVREWEADHFRPD